MLSISSFYVLCLLTATDFSVSLKTASAIHRFYLVFDNPDFQYPSIGSVYYHEYHILLGQYLCNSSEITLPWCNLNMHAWILEKNTKQEQKNKTHKKGKNKTSFPLQNVCFWRLNRYWNWSHYQCLEDKITSNSKLAYNKILITYYWVKTSIRVKLDTF